ncbi:hypothetical protein [Glycomyces sp. NPDC047010]|uniref:hypothetical protein n=1 Tax=Glycomyces sp. NPDC047010 TaxID=3155023 RepID=UPI00340389C0
MNEPISGLLAETGKHLAQRFVNALAFPGLLFVAAVATAVELGMRHSVDIARLVDAGQQLADQFNHRPVPALFAVLAAGLAACTAGIVCAGLSRVLRYLWLRNWPRWRAQQRMNRWLAADVAFRTATAGTDEAARLASVRNAIALAKPTQATWSGDRLAASGQRVWAEYGLDLTFSWPRLWLLLPDTARDEVRQAGQAFTAARVWQAWGVLYLLLGILWWPAGLAGVVTLFLGWRHGRTVVATLADLIEACYDLHVKALIDAIDGPDRLLGEQVNVRLRKGA